MVATLKLSWCDLGKLASDTVGNPKDIIEVEMMLIFSAN